MDNKKNRSLLGRKMYIPRMSFSAAKLTASAFRSIGVDAMPSPASDGKTMELGSKYLTGEECLPEKITLGNFLKIIEEPSFEPQKTAFLLPTAGGPCRFGQYQNVLKKILRDKGLSQAMVVSPTSTDGYEGFGASAQDLFRTSWHAILAGDILRKMHLKTRPYELEKGRANFIFHQALDELSEILATPQLKHNFRLKLLRQCLVKTQQRYFNIPSDYKKDKPLIGIVGEIYCRLNEFSNEYLVNKIEEMGGEVWMTDISEWIWYTNDEQRWRIIRAGKKFSKDMLAAKIKIKIQKNDETFLLKPLKKYLRGYEEPHKIKEILEYSRPFLPQEGALGEMVLNAGKSIYLYKKGADGIIDISPFSCMNGVVCETVYPQISKKLNNFPIRIFYFDGTQTDLERDVGIFLELAKNYKIKKKPKRIYPTYFK
jgi:predicted nucleotide-binding protein (sugar kinase/HSP70/actin superfamily)